MAEYVEGKRAVLEALRSGMPIKCLHIAEGAHDKAISDITHRAHKQSIPVRQARRAELDKRSVRGSHQGVMLEVAPFGYSSAHEIITRATQHAKINGGNALIVMLDHITDAGNLGAIARSAEVVGASGIIIPNKRAARVTTATYKSSAGAIAHIPVAQVSNLSQTIEAVKQQNFWVIGATEHAEQGIWDTPFTGRIVLVMGSEGDGLSRLVQKSCDFLTALPQVGEVASLNVAQAATACMYEWLRQTQHKKPEGGAA